MELADAALTWANQAALLVIAAVAVRDALRSRLKGAFAVATAALVVVSVAASLNGALGYRFRILFDVAVVALAVSAYGLVETRHSVARLPRPVRVGVSSVLAAGAIFVLVLRVPMDPASRGPAGVEAVAMALPLALWAICVVGASVSLVAIARTRPPVEAVRLRLIGLGYGGIAAGMVALVLTSSGSRTGGVVDVAVGAAVLVFIVPALYVAVAPPAWLRERWLRGAADREAGRLLPVGTWFWDRPSRRLHWSSVVADLLGVPRGGPTTPEVFFDRVHPEDRDGLREVLAEAALGRSPFALDVRIVRDGAEGWLNVRGRPVADPAGGGTVAVLGTIHDVTERKATEGKLLESRGQLEEAQRLARVGSYVLDLTTGDIAWSPELYRIYGVEAGTEPPFEEIIQYLHPDERPEVERRLGELIADGVPREDEFRIVRADGEERWCMGRAEPILDADGAVVGLRGTVQDVTDRKRTEDALREAYERERDAAERIRALDAMKEDFLEAVSHELRTPITSLLGYAELLGAPEAADHPEHVRHVADRIGVNADRLARLLEELLDIDRGSRGMLEIDRMPTDLAHLVRRSVAQVDLGGRAVELDLDGVVAPVGPVQFERVVMNVVENAALHTPLDAPVLIRLRGDPEEVCLVVEDAGPGVPDGEKGAVFEAFRRGPGSAARAGGGGVGLALVKRVAELHGGTAWVEDRPGGGARFCVLLRPGRGLEIGSPDGAPPAADEAVRGAVDRL